jgi:hypothetical protein
VCALRGATFLLAITVAFSAGCSDDDEDGGDGVTPMPTPEASSAAPGLGESPIPNFTAPPEPEATRVTVTQSFEHDGWRVTISSVTLEGGEAPSVIIEALFENQGTESATFDAPLAIRAGGEAYMRPTADQDLPAVPGGLNGGGTIAIAVDNDFTLDGAMLVVGDIAGAGVSVPLTPAQ